MGAWTMFLERRKRSVVNVKKTRMQKNEWKKIWVYKNIWYSNQIAWKIELAWGIKNFELFCYSFSFFHFFIFFVFFHCFHHFIALFSYHLGVEVPSGEWTLSGCCSPTKFDRPRAACQRRWVVADREGCLLCLEFSIWRFQWYQTARPLK